MTVSQEDAVDDGEVARHRDAADEFLEELPVHAARGKNVGNEGDGVHLLLLGYELYGGRGKLPSLYTV